MNQTPIARETPEPSDTTMYVVCIDEAYFIGGPRTLEEAHDTARYYGGKVYRLVPVVDAKETPRHESTCVYYELGSCNCGAI